MTHPNFQTNGASLEDCHTNFFALTDLCGIKWRRLSVENVLCVDPLDDPVLLSFSKCLNADILSVWRRIQCTKNSCLLEPDQHHHLNHHHQQPHLHPHPNHTFYNKELWIFWYGEEPDLTNIICPELTEVEQGSWDSGLSYECRSLLFKALHNLIERCLVSRDFIRLGKWFVQPFDIQEKPAKSPSPHLSFSFSFFVHGESTVCATVDVRQHPAVFRLSPCHIQTAQGSHSGIQVILGPYGLCGILTGQTYKDNTHSTQKLLDEWRQFYPIDPKFGARDCLNERHYLPSLVEVVVGGVKMRYPSCYVIVVEGEDVQPTNSSSSLIMPLPSHHPTATKNTNVPPNSAMSWISMTPPTSPCDTSVFALGLNRKHSAGNSNRILSSGAGQMTSLSCSSSSADSNRLSRKVLGHVWQHSTLHVGTNTTTHSNAVENSNDADSIGHWDYMDPSQKLSCNCSKCRKSKQSTNQVKGNSLNGVASNQPSCSGKKGDRIDKQQPRHSRGNMPFHRRSPVNDDLASVDPDYMSQRVPVTTGNSSYQFKGIEMEFSRLLFVDFKGIFDVGCNPVATGGLPQLRTSILDPIASTASPHSSAPSPLVASHSQPASVTQTDPTMPTLSPHPPASKENDVSAEDIADKDNQSLPSNSNANTSPLELNKDGPKSVSDQGFSPFPNSLDQNKTYEILNWTQNQGQTCPALESGQGLKRPSLPFKVYEDQMEEELLSDGLYDYSALNAWLNHPVKKFKPEQKAEIKSTSRPGSVSENQASPMKEPLTPQSQLANDLLPAKAADPYEFEDEMPPVFSMSGFKSKNETSKEDEAPQSAPAANEASFPPSKDNKGLASNEAVASPPTPVNSSSKSKMLTSQDLRATYNDLDQLFDTSDDECSDDPFQAPTPTGSLKTIGSTTDEVTSKNKSSDIVGLHGPTDISRMFPTPPSLEHNPTPSPGIAPGSTDMTLMESDGIIMAKERSDIFPNCGSPSDENIMDWTYVFKPATQAKFVGSSKFAPLTNLPSQVSPPIFLPSQCVYKPSWQYPLPIIDKHAPSSHLVSVPSVEPIERIHSVASNRSMEPSPATFPTSLDHRMASSNYELASPASNASSYLNKNLNSIDNSLQTSQIPEAHSVLANVLLSDSMLNLFKDHNFNSCTMCVCQMDVYGADAGLYLSDASGANREALYKCTCGFSAVVNRKYAFRAGLFYEDEVEITGIREDLPDRRKPLHVLLGKEANDANVALDHVPQILLEILRNQCTTLAFSCSLSRKTGKAYQNVMASCYQNTLEISNGCESVMSALEQGRQMLDSISTCRLDDALKATCLHKWPHSPAKVPASSQDVMRLLRCLQPLLQDAIQKKRTAGLWETTYSVSGPLTWRQFHRLVGRAGTEDQCEPQPIPSLLVGYDKDWLALSPFAIKYWEKLLLEPYSSMRDVAYIVVAPDNDYVLSNVRTFFRELSSAYEVCRLGRHCPITKVLRDGIMRVGKTAAKKLADEPVDEWFNLLGDSSIANKLKLYAQVCRYRLAPHLSMQPMDRTLLESPVVASKPADKTVPVASPMPPPTPESQDRVPTPKSDTNEGSDSSQTAGPKEVPYSSSGGSAQEPWEQDDESQVPAVVVYMVDPFTYWSDHPEVHRLATLGLVRCYLQVIRCLPENIQNNIHLQIVPLESILEHTQNEGSGKQLDHLKALAFSVFSQCRRILIHQAAVKSLTGFGSAATAEAFLKTKDEKNVAAYRMYSPPFILAPMKDKQAELGESFGERKEKCTVLYTSYCLSEDQRWLLATCTDDRGEIMESIVINIEIPNRNRRKKASARKVALQKLMDWVLGVMSTGNMPWRLVIGRLGRLGHGWSSLLGRKFLLRASKHLKDICKQCLFLNAQDTPCVLSACLISTESDPILRIMHDQYTPDERFGSSCNSCDLSTPQDASCTHLLVFPTSATTQSTQATFLPDPGLADDDILDVLKEDLQEVDAIFDWADSPVASPVGSPRKDPVSLPGSPGLGVSGHQSPYQTNGAGRSSDGLSSDPQEENPQLLQQQPLALGYCVSTAKTGPLPKCFWTTCTQLEDTCPSFLKSALHIHSPSIQQSSDDPLQQHSHQHNYHPLDSSLTTDVLRYVLEGYNALSWLSIDPVSHDRRSCLPVHIQSLMQLYYALAPLV
uniref:Mediator of RNA polymerase II transcription subunit 13 n=1 Tax=Strigamia maritima TaxID=126957 RepID=T1IJV1_STRMM